MKTQEIVYITAFANLFRAKKFATPFQYNFGVEIWSNIQEAGKPKIGCNT